MEKAMNRLEELTQQADAKGIELYDYIAKELFGVVTPDTRGKAKKWAYVYEKSPWIETFPSREPREYHQEYDICPFLAHSVHSEDRMHRVGVATYNVRVFQDCGDYVDYTIRAMSSLDARCLAFVLDGGCESGMADWDDGHIELAFQYTEVIQ